MDEEKKKKVIWERPEGQQMPGETTNVHTYGLEEFKGVFSSNKKIKIGHGGTSRSVDSQSYYYVQQLAPDQFEVQPLNKNYVPSGPKQVISKDDLIKNFNPEPDFFVKQVDPAMRKLNKTVATGDRHLKRKEYFSAEWEYGKALKVDEDNIRANFGIGISYLERGEKERADNVFQKLVTLNAAFEEEHKHLFNDFGINLRKQKMHDQAVEYYSRALEFSQDDEHLYYNIARAYYELGKRDKASEHVAKALELNPDLHEAKQLAKVVDKETDVYNRSAEAAAKEAHAKAGQGSQGGKKSLDVDAMMGGGQGKEKKKKSQPAPARSKGKNLTFDI
jgi:tetratricopeptide (TPR) repeat protein